MDVTYLIMMEMVMEMVIHIPGIAWLQRISTVNSHGLRVKKVTLPIIIRWFIIMIWTSHMRDGKRAISITIAIAQSYTPTLTIT